MGNPNEKRQAIKDLQSLANIGPAIAERLYSVGIKTAKQMRRCESANLEIEVKNDE